MALLIQRAINGLIPARFSRSRPPSLATRPDRILLGVRPGERPSDKPPVRIYLGTERGQFRAERIFLWSIEKYRDPSRIYEIYLMRDIKGFKRGFWLTGFTNYRFAIPEFAGYSGRAIYNDADQIYLADPAKLFDLDMGKAGFLSINDRDTSVMLIDCQRMADAWNGHDVRRLSRKALESRARQAGLWGELDGGWNARDSEYHPKHSMLVHFTTLHTQPWRPFPEQLVYFPNPTGQLWPDLEDEANVAQFLPFSAKRPSRHWNLLSLQQTEHAGAHGSADYPTLLSPEPPSQRQDSLVVDRLLERVPDEDISWVLQRLMQASRQLVLSVREPLSQQAGRYRRSRYFWLQHLNNASAMVPDCRWRLNHHAGLWRRPTQVCGGPTPAGDIVALTHHKPGHDAQALAIAQALSKATGRPLRRLQMRPHHCLIPGAVQAAMEDAAVVVASGWWPTRLARRLAKRQPELRLVLAGRKAGPAPEYGGIVLQCRHFGLPPHPRQWITDLPLNAGPAPLADAHAPEYAAWQPWLSAEHRVALLLGGPSRNVVFSAEQAALLARQVSDWSRAHNARLLVVGSRRSAPILRAVRQGLSEQDLLYVWQDQDPSNPYGLALTQAQHLVVTTDSESMLADAAHSGGAFWVLEPGPMKHSIWQRFSTWVAARATRPRFNRRGSIRPQQGINYLCARALAQHWVLPPRDLPALAQRLIQSGQAAPFIEASQTALLAVAKPHTNTRSAPMAATIDRIITVLSLQSPESVGSAGAERHHAR